MRWSAAPSAGKTTCGRHVRERGPMKTGSGYKTRQRGEVIAVLENAHGAHVTAKQVHEELARGGSTIGAATVYRQLERLVDEGLARRYNLGPGEAACHEYAAGNPAPTSTAFTACTVCASSPRGMRPSGRNRRSFVPGARVRCPSAAHGLLRGLQGGRRIKQGGVGKRSLVRIGENGGRYRAAALSCGRLPAIERCGAWRSPSFHVRARYGARRRAFACEAVRRARIRASSPGAARGRPRYPSG